MATSRLHLDAILDGRGVLVVIWFRVWRWHRASGFAHVNNPKNIGLVGHASLVGAFGEGCELADHCL
jgi:hypothetical protein